MDKLRNLINEIDLQTGSIESVQVMLNAFSLDLEERDPMDNKCYIAGIHDLLEFYLDKVGSLISQAFDTIEQNV